MKKFVLFPFIFIVLISASAGEAIQKRLLKISEIYDYGDLVSLYVINNNSIVAYSTRYKERKFIIEDVDALAIADQTAVPGNSYRYVINYNGNKKYRKRVRCIRLLYIGNKMHRGMNLPTYTYSAKKAKEFLRKNPKAKKAPARVSSAPRQAVGGWSFRSL